MTTPAAPQHTPGPWYVTGAEVHSCAPGTDRWVATVSAGQGDKPRAADYANARLIAAAPEMYEALKGIQAALLSALKDRVDLGAPGVVAGIVRSVCVVGVVPALAKAEGHSDA